MKKHAIKFIITALFISLFISCKDDINSSSNEPVDAYNVTFYKITDKSGYNSPDFLQASINNGTIQFATFGDIGSDGLPGSFNKAYVYDKQENTEAIILFDDQMEPAFIYSVDLASGKKLASMNEFERIDPTKFYYRLYHYDWTNRIGTLLFETVITQEGHSFTSAPTFQINDADFDAANKIKGKELGSQEKTNVIVKGKRVLKAPIMRLEYLQKLGSMKKTTSNTNDIFDDWSSSFEILRESGISAFLAETSGTSFRIGVAGALVALGAAATSPAWIAGGAIVAVAGVGLALAGTAINMVQSDMWADRLAGIQDRINEIKDSATGLIEESFTLGNDVVNLVDDYRGQLDNWLNTEITFPTIGSLIDSIEEQEIISNESDLDDLPDSNGVLQIGLSWDTFATDIDLWVTDPSGEKIYYRHRSSASGGYLDRDDTDGIGPENIYWLSNVPSGQYQVQVHYFGCSGSTCPSTNYSVKVSNGLGYSRTYNGTLTAKDQVNQVVSFVVNGKNIQ